MQARNVYLVVVEWVGGVGDSRESHPPLALYMLYKRHTLFMCTEFEVSPNPPLSTDTRVA